VQVLESSDVAAIRQMVIREHVLGIPERLKAKPEPELEVFIACSPHARYAHSP